MRASLIMGAMRIGETDPRRLMHIEPIPHSMRELSVMRAENGRNNDPTGGGWHGSIAGAEFPAILRPARPRLAQFSLNSSLFLFNSQFSILTHSRHSSFLRNATHLRRCRGTKKALEVICLRSVISVKEWHPLTGEMAVN